MEQSNDMIEQYILSVTHLFGTEYGAKIHTTIQCGLCSIVRSAGIFVRTAEDGYAAVGTFV